MLDPTLARPRFKPVGITKGPGENAHEYTFVSRDDEQVLKNGEYVYYELEQAENEGQLQNGAGQVCQVRRVLGRIIRRVPAQLSPGTSLAVATVCATPVPA